MTGNGLGYISQDIKACSMCCPYAEPGVANRSFGSPQLEAAAYGGPEGVHLGQLDPYRS